MKDNIISLECINCGVYIYPPSEVSDVGKEDYEEIYVLPQYTQDQIPTKEDLEIASIRLKKAYSKDDWIAAYNNWLSEYKNTLKERAEQRVQELQNKLLNVQIVEEENAIKIIGKRYKARLQVFENGWRLKCPNCGFTLVECWWGYEGGSV